MKYRILKLEPSRVKNADDAFIGPKADDFQTDYAAAQRYAEEWVAERSGRVAIVTADRGTYRSQAHVTYTPGPSDE